MVVFYGPQDTEAPLRNTDGSGNVILDDVVWPAGATVYADWTGVSKASGTGTRWHWDIWDMATNTGYVRQHYWTDEIDKLDIVALGWGSSQWRVQLVGVQSTGTVHSFKIDVHGLSPAGYCQYGTRRKDPSISVVQVDPGLISTILSIVGGNWARVGVILNAAGWLYTEALCAQPPPDDVQLDPQDFIPSGIPWLDTPAIKKLRQKLNRSMWLQYCECVPATPPNPPATSYPITIWNQPTWYVTQVNQNISNVDIASTLNLVLNNQATYNISNSDITNITSNTYDTTNNNSVTINQIAGDTGTLVQQSRCPPPAYEEGTVHEDLIGTGRFEVDQVVGFKIEAIERNISEPILAGQPMYLWNMGWISTLAGELLLEEKRVTREGYLWFPCSINYATEFTYTLRDFTKIRVTELVAPAAPPALP